MESEPLPLAVTYDTAARMLECSSDTVRDLVTDGYLHVVKVKTLARISVDELRAFIASGGTSPNRRYAASDAVSA